MKKVFKWMGIAFVALFAVMILFATVGLREAVNLPLQAVSLVDVPDGRYTGAYQNGRFSNTVTVTVENHAISAITPDQVAQGRGALTQELIGKVIAAQQPNVDTVAGATASSRSFLKAVETALLSAPGAQASGT